MENDARSNATTRTTRRALSTFDDLRAQRSYRGFDVTDAARDVIVIVMSARSGSSWLIEMLKQSLDLVHLRGEVTTFLRLHGLSYPHAGCSEALDSDAAARVDDLFRHDLSLEAGWPSERLDDPARFCAEVQWRLRLQWPDTTFPTDIADLIMAELERSNDRQGQFDADSFTRALITKLSRDLFVDPDFYDFGQEPTSASDVLPWERLLESPPFIPFRPWQMADPSDLAERPLVIKSAGDVYRLSFYKALFPKARFRVIHLRRNPAASLNGLLDAWSSAKYQSFNVGGLDIDGYSDLPEKWRRDWWKLDLFPGWEKWKNASLIEVCTVQWCTAQRVVLDWLQNTACEHFPVHYEDLIRSRESRKRVMGDLCEWIGIPIRDFMETRVMNASAPPRSFRWKRRRQEILPMVESAMCRDVTSRLGYSWNPEYWP